MRRANEKNQPLVSVITVVLNGEKSIERTIQSVINQNYKNIEYIIIDGGSIDRTLDITERYKEHIAHIISEHDEGISDAFNKGIRRSSGAFIAILNSDDVLASGSVARSVEALQGNLDYGFVFGHCVHMYGNDRSWLNLGDQLYDKKIRRRMPDINHPTVMMRREIYDKFGMYHNDFRLAMDYEFHLRIHVSGIRGELIDHIQAEMQLAGVSDRRWCRTCLEVRDISILHGKPRLVANLMMFFYLLRGFTRRSLMRIGLKSLVYKIRIFNQRRKVIMVRNNLE